jgi:serine/threonine kinase PknH
MKVFVSYSRRDDAPVRSLVADLQRARQQVWLDEDLGGGEAWWTQILEQVRDCTVFVLALSKNSLSSKPCRAELD